MNKQILKNLYIIEIECSPMVQETEVQSQVESYERQKNGS